jgi:hypothetical protein
MASTGETKNFGKAKRRTSQFGIMAIQSDAQNTVVFRSIRKVVWGKFGVRSDTFLAGPL